LSIPKPASSALTFRLKLMNAGLGAGRQERHRGRKGNKTTLGVAAPAPDHRVVPLWGATLQRSKASGPDSWPKDQQQRRGMQTDPGIRMHHDIPTGAALRLSLGTLKAPSTGRPTLDLDVIPLWETSPGGS
jgi:hypothetical protein